MKVAIDVLPPQMPNFLRTTAADYTIAVKDLTDTDVEQVILLWASAFRSHVEQKRQLARLEAHGRRIFSGYPRHPLQVREAQR